MGFFSDLGKIDHCRPINQQPHNMLQPLNFMTDVPNSAMVDGTIMLTYPQICCILPNWRKLAQNLNLVYSFHCHLAAIIPTPVAQTL